MGALRDRNSLHDTNAPSPSIRRYMEVVYAMPTFGCAFFRCTANNSNKVKPLAKPFPEVLRNA
jgi:hypothetical protein